MSNARSGCLGGLLLSMVSAQLGCFGTVILLIVFGVAAYYAAKLLVEIVRILLITGALFGLAITVRNYAQALYHNVKREKVTP